MRDLLASPLGRYRLMAYVVGTGLLVLVLVAVPLKYLAGEEGPVAVVGTLHGYLFIGYVIAAFHLSRVRRWSPVKTVLVMLAGTIPFVSFIVERRVAAEAAPVPVG